MTISNDMEEGEWGLFHRTSLTLT